MNQSSDTAPITQQLSKILEDCGFSRFGFTTLKTPVSLEFYRQWLKDQMQGEMSYLESHLPLKEDPTLLLAKAQTAIVVAVDYLPHPRPRMTSPNFKVALYAQGQDYHLWLKEKLEVAVQNLQAVFPKEKFLAATDSKPVLERDLAYRAGLGWVGKNTCLIDQRKGSYFFIGEILTTLSFSSVHTSSENSSQNIHAIHPDRCGTCTRCIDACPTQAIIAPKKLDARRCISYLTIESKSVPPLDLRKKINDWFFGCDICQQVCPWNEKAFGSKHKGQVFDRGAMVSELKFFLVSSSRKIEESLKDSPLLRARPFGLRRNAIVVAANLRLVELRDDIVALKADERLKDLVSWALAELSQPETTVKK